MKLPVNILRLSFFLSTFCLTTALSLAQCPSGAIGVASGGCQSGCNLTSFGGPNCGSGTTGNGSVQNVTVNISVPAGCTFTVNATMGLRPGCNSGSGADNGDGMKVDLPAGSKPFQSTTGDGTLNDSYTLVGPGTITVFCRANRRDEIVSYSVTSSGALCTACNSVLPIELRAFEAVASGDYVTLNWATETERDNDYFTVERSADGKEFTPIAHMPGAGNSQSPLHYTQFDLDPLEGLSYYRLKQTDFDGKYTYSSTESVYFERSVQLYPNPAKTSFTLSGKYIQQSAITVTNALGQHIVLPTIAVGERELMVDTNDLLKGVYFVTIVYNNQAEVRRVVVE